MELSQDFKFCPRCAYRLRPDLVEHGQIAERVQGPGARLVALGGYLAFASLLLLMALAGIGLFIEQSTQPGDAKAGTLVVRVRDLNVLGLTPDDFLAVSGGEVIWGLHRDDLYEDPEANELPRTFTIDDAFKIGRFEITNDQYLTFLADLARRGRLRPGRIPVHWKRPSKDVSLGVPFVYARGQGNHPVVNVSFQDALEFAFWFWETRLDRDPDVIVDVPTSHEFVRAGRGDRLDYNFPWGFALGDQKVNFTLKKTVPVTSREAGCHGGLYALVGNVAEWVHRENRRELAGGSFNLERELHAKYANKTTIFDQEPWPESTPFGDDGFEWPAADRGYEDAGFRLVIRQAPHLPEFVDVKGGRVRYGRPKKLLLPPTAPVPLSADLGPGDGEGFRALESLNCTFNLPDTVFWTSVQEPDAEAHRLTRRDDEGNPVADGWILVTRLDDARQHMAMAQLAKSFEEDDFSDLRDARRISERSRARLGGQPAHVRTIRGWMNGEEWTREAITCRLDKEAYRFVLGMPAAESAESGIARELQALRASFRFLNRQVRDDLRDFSFQIPSSSDWEMHETTEKERDAGLYATFTREDDVRLSLYCLELRRDAADLSLADVASEKRGALARILGRAEPAGGAASLGGVAGFKLVERSRIGADEVSRSWILCRRLTTAGTYLYVYGEELRRDAIDDEPLHEELEGIRDAFRFLREEPVRQPGGVDDVSAFKISRTEVTNRQYQAFLADVAPTIPEERLDELIPTSIRWVRRARSFGYGPGEANRPVWVRSVQQAQAYAEWLGNMLSKRCRLPTVAEYLRAGRGDSIAPYPRGENSWSPALVSKSAWYPDARRTVSLLGRLAPNPPKIVGLVGNVLEYVRRDGTDDDWLLAGGWFEVEPPYCTLDSYLDPSWNYVNEPDPGEEDDLYYELKSGAKGFRVVLVGAE
ncbi:MAG: SUMF1/EgtB/PvdO family nonheme iron enzyme [Planctomycetota bacterium]|nr:SUMF1/EgtB/PvdO family nonheme iron enzyme [Planctomycetota bacterium]